MATSPIIFLSGYYGFANTGDEAILIVLLAEWRARVPDARFLVVSGNPEHTEAAHGVKAVLWSDPLAIAEAVQSADLVVIGGGGLFHDYSGFIPDALLTSGNWGVGFHVTPAILAALYRRPLMLHAVGVGPLYSGHARRYLHAACDAALAITVRDEPSRDLLADCGVSPDRVRVSSDPVFAWRPDPSIDTAAIFEKEGITQWQPDPRPRVCVAIRHWSLGTHPEYWQQEVARALDRFIDAEGGSVVFLPFQRLSGEKEDDSAVASRTLAKMRHSHDGRAMMLKGSYSPAEVAAIAGSCDLVLGMRLHSLIFSMVYGKPCVALSYDPKVAHAAAQAGLSDCCVELTSMTAEPLCEHLREALATRPLASAEVLGRLRAEAVRDVELAAGLIGQPPSPLSAEHLDMVRTATLALLRKQSRLEAQIAADTERHRDEIHYRDRLAREQAERIQGLTIQLRQLAAEKADLLSRLHFYTKDLSQRLKDYRSQRAWSIMLAIRKGYVMAFRSGFRGKMRFMRWLPGALIGRPGELESQELKFPGFDPGSSL